MIDPMIADRVEELSYDIFMCLRTGLPVSVQSEYELMALLDDNDIQLDATQSLWDLAAFLLDYDGDGAWNIKNMIVGAPAT